MGTAVIVIGIWFGVNALFVWLRYRAVKARAIKRSLEAIRTEFVS